MQREFGTSFSFVSQDQTKPTKPSTPERLKSTFQTNSSVFLSWRLAWPPTGNLDKFLLEVDKYSIQIHNTNTQHKYTIHNTQYKYFCPHRQPQQVPPQVGRTDEEGTVRWRPVQVSRTFHCISTSSASPHVCLLTLPSTSGGRPPFL